MTIRRNVVANYTAQGVVTLLGILVVPAYLGMLGAEAYGLIGFFAVLQTIFNLLDAGLSPALSREAARYRAHRDALHLRRIYRPINQLFIAGALLAGGTLFLFADRIGTSWLQSSTLNPDDITFAIRVMAIGVALRWYSGLQRGLIVGWERQVWLAGFNIAVACFRFLGVLVLMKLVGATVYVFFSYQAALAVIEFTALFLMARHLLPKIDDSKRIGWSWRPVLPVLKFAFSVSFAAIVWVGITQSDKIVLSKLLPLESYGYYTLGVVVAGAVMMTATPLSDALRPRMAMLDAAGRSDEVIRIYRASTQFIAIIAGAVGFSLAMFSRPLLMAWTGDPVAAEAASPILRLYALGNVALALAALPYYLQFAKGNLKLHVIGNILFAIFLIPAIIWATLQFGGVGAAWVWFGANIMFLTVWAPIVHQRFAPGMHMSWLMVDILPILAATALTSLFISSSLPTATGRVVMAAEGALMGIAALAAGFVASSAARTRFTRLALTWRRNS